MPISIDYGATNIIDIPQSDLTVVSGTLYTYDTDAFRAELNAYQDNETGIVFPDTHTHNTEVTLAGIVYARFIEMLSPYQVRFEDGQYTVVLEGSNNNVWDVQGGILFRNQVQVIPQNAAGLIVRESGVSGLTAQESADLTLMRELMEADEFFDVSEGLLHYYRKGTTTDLIPAKTVAGFTATSDTSATE